MSSWRGTECSVDVIVLKSVVFHLVFWMSSFFLCLVCVRVSVSAI